MAISRKTKRRLNIALLAAATASLLVPIALDWSVSKSSSDYVFRSLAEVPEHRVGLVLGTAPLVSGRKNLFFEGRMNAAAELYHAGKVTKLLLSGDNRTIHYNEPEAMKKALVERGVPVTDLVLDYAGLHTLDSVVRAKRVFGQNQFIVISDDFHVERAVYIARAHGIESVGYATARLPNQVRRKTRIREVGARCMMMFDLYIARTEPKFLGEMVAIN